MKQTHPIRELMDKESLTCLSISHDWRSERVCWRASYEWDGSVPWKGYQKTFTFEDCLTASPRYFGHEAVLGMFRANDSEGVREEIEGLLKAGRHQGIDFLREPNLDITFMNNMHSNVLGIKNGMHAIRAGGIRRHPLTDPEMEVIVDGLNLARAMSFKNGAAKIPFGGCKCTVHSDVISMEDMERLGFLAYCLDRSRFFTGPDMGFPPELADVFHEHFTANITGGKKGPLGPTGTPTAYGVYLAIKAAAEFRYGDVHLREKRVLIQGLGAVGFPLAELLIKKERCSLIVSDVDATAVERLKETFPEATITVVAPETVLDTLADIFAPCAMGGIISEREIPRLQFDIILGSANNVLAAHSQEEEIALAERLAERGILYEVEWVHNIAGVMAGYEEYMRGKEADRARLFTHIERVCGFGVKQNLQEAKHLGITPTEYAYRQIEKKIYPDLTPSP
jgi:glutamate dehydrogenase/leucine dehydrogenase